MSLYVDTSRKGMHGIGRYSSEVVNRLELPWRDLGQRLRKPLPVDALNPSRMLLRSGDLVYAPGFNSGLSRARQLLTLHDLIHLQVRSEGSGLKRAYYESIVRPVVRRAGVVFTVSDTSRQAIAEWLGDDDVEIVNTGNGVSEVFSPAGPSWSGDSNYLLYVGNFREHKNTSVMLDALVRLPDARLVVVTSDIAQAEREVANRVLMDRVSILSEVDDAALASVYRGALGLIMPSTLEGFGLPAAEALASGIKVAFWDGCASVREIVGDNGVAVSARGSVDAWVEAMVELGDSGRGFEWPRRSTYSWSTVAEVVESRLTEELRGAV